MEISVLGFNGIIIKGGYGYFVCLQNREFALKKIAKYYNLSIDLDAYVCWKPLFDKISHINLEDFDYHYMFPEFKSKICLLKFVELLNNNLNESILNFIKLSYFV